MEINNLPSLRYSITNTGNGGTYDLNIGMRRIAPQMTTYSQLTQKHIAQLRLHTRASSQQQVVRNHETALRSFLATVHKTEASVVGPELGTDFDSSLAKHLSTIALGARSKADRKSLLRAWKSTYDNLTEAQTQPTRSRRERHSSDAGQNKCNAFEVELKRALKAAGLSAKSAARLAGVSTAAVGRWCRGALPNRRSEPTLSKLEGVLDLPAGHLSAVLAGCLPGDTSPPPNSFRARLRAATSQAYRLQSRDATSALREEWTELLHYKTSTRPPGGLKRSSSGEWTLSQPRHSVMRAMWFNSIGEAVCHSADKAWHMLTGFLGFIKLAPEAGGYGRSSEEAQTLAWLCVPDAVDGYLHFMADRSDGLKHEGHKTFCTMLKALVRPSVGFLRQKMELAERLPIEAREKLWDELCDEVCETVSTWAKQATDTSRDPDEAIAFFLDKPQPLKPIFDAMNTLRRLADGCTPGSTMEATLRRDELLLGFLISNPLRAKNISTLTWNSNNSGHIYKTVDGQWRLKIQPREFKNRRKAGKKKAKTYDVAVASWLAPLLEEYITRYLPVLVGEALTSCFLFTTRNGKKMSSLNKKVLVLTKRLIPGCGGIGPHAFRHLVATVWLRNHTNDFFVVAELLNDSLQVVIDNYAHLKKDVSFSKYEAYVALSR